MAVTLGCPEEAVNEPRLTAELCGHPAKRIGDIGKRKCQHDWPEQPPARFQLASKSLQRGQTHQGDKNRSEGHHQMERVVEKLDIIRPILFRKFIQTAHVAFEGAVGEKAQAARYLDGIVEPLQRYIWFAEDADVSHVAAMETAL